MKNGSPRLQTVPVRNDDEIPISAKSDERFLPVFRRIKCSQNARHCKDVVSVLTEGPSFQSGLDREEKLLFTVASIRFTNVLKFHTGEFFKLVLIKKGKAFVLKTEES
jgi:hypothetical protein